MIDQVEFEMTEDHLKLLKQMNIRWHDLEFGAPEVNPKRPYGNSDVYLDIAEHLGIDIPDDNEEFSEETKKHMWKIHRETETALQVILKTNTFETGVYIADKYMRDWRRKMPQDFFEQTGMVECPKCGEEIE